MKKALKVVFAMVMVACLLCTSAFAAGSPTTSAAGASVEEGKTISVDASPVSITAQEAATIINKTDVPATSLSNVFLYNVTTNATKVHFDFTGHGFVFHYNGASWDLVGEGNNGCDVTLSSWSPVAIFVTSSTSAKTADTFAPIAALGVALVAAAAATFVLRRKEA